MDIFIEIWVVGAVSFVVMIHYLPQRCLRAIVKVRRRRWDKLGTSSEVRRRAEIIWLGFSLPSRVAHSRAQDSSNERRVAPSSSLRPNDQ